MTRFARKNTSRGNTQREPEEATPWSQMVQLIKPAEDFGVEDDDDFMDGDDGERAPGGGEEEDSSEEEEEAQVRILSQDEEDEEDSEDDLNIEVSLTEAAKKAEKRKAAVSSNEGPQMKKERLENSQSSDEDSEDDYEERLAAGDSEKKVELVSSDEPKKKKKKKKRAEKCKVCGSKEHRKMDCEMLPEERRKELQELYNLKVGRAGQGTGRKKKKNKNKLPYEDNNNENIDSKENIPSSGEHKKRNNKNNKFKKFSQPVRDRSGAVVEEGEVLFHGFRVRREDQKKLTDLYKKLKEQGLTKKELEAAIKKERRIAEKSLARSKKLVCFKCRQPGHMLADCPQGGDKDDKRPDSGLCFKCGSLEHKSKDCKSKLKRENAYNFATCFICKEEGHLAKACPDNPKGLYPKGGGCVFCGSVEHLKRDCPRKVAKDLKTGVRATTIGDNLEDEPSFISRPANLKVKKKKIVTF